MINDKNIIYWVWLSQVLGEGNPDVEYILSKIDSPKDLYDFGQKRGYDNIKFLSRYIINKMKNIKIEIAKDIVEKCKSKKYEIITINDKQYPYRLKNIYSSPLLIYVNGIIEDIDNDLTIAIIGARRCSEYAVDVTKLFAKQLAINGVTIVSGMAVGIDGIALEEALNNDGKVIAVLGCGLDVDYPLKNLKLKDMIETSPNGCIISEYPPGTRPFASNFPVRNRIMAGLSVGVLVVEAGERSGSLITAKIATDQGKDVYGVPNNIFVKNNIGTMNLLKEGAMIVTDPSDIINQYKFSNIRYRNYEYQDIIEKDKSLDFDQDKHRDNKHDDEKRHISIDKANKEDYNLDGILKDIYDLLKKDGPQTADCISEKLNILINEILINITQLELIGAIKSYPGMKYGIN